MYHPLFQFVDSTLPFEKINNHEQLRKYNYRWCIVKSRVQRLTGDFCNNPLPIIIGLVARYETKWDGGESGPTLCQIWPRNEKGNSVGSYCFSGAMLPSFYKDDLEIRYLSMKEKSEIMSYIRLNPKSVNFTGFMTFESMSKWQ